MQTLFAALGRVNDILWHPWVLYIVLATGVLFTLWTGVAQFRSITHGVQLVRGRYQVGNAPGALTHFQALSAALSATVGLGNIGGVALAVALGGPGAVFWMWVVGFVGMALKLTEVTLSMLYRSTPEGSEPHGGPMWVAQRGFAAMGPKWRWLGGIVGSIFCVTLLVSAITSGNMFQAWNVAVVTEQSFGVPSMVTGVILTVLVALVILGGIRRIGAVAGALVPLMCGIYLLAALYVLAVNVELIPSTFALIVRGAFSPLEAHGAFVGGTAGYAFAWGMKRALFSNEAGQGSSPIAHSAARTSEPVSEGIVAGLEPFIDTLLVCTITALVILTSGAWNREPEAMLPSTPTISDVGDGRWQIAAAPLPERPEGWPQGNDVVFTVVQLAGPDGRHQRPRQRQCQPHRQRLPRRLRPHRSAGSTHLATASDLPHLSRRRLDEPCVRSRATGPGPLGRDPCSVAICALNDDFLELLRRTRNRLLDWRARGDRLSHRVLRARRGRLRRFHHH